jgi:hypothetical protein
MRLAYYVFVSVVLGSRPAQGQDTIPLLIDLATRTGDLGTEAITAGKTYKLHLMNLVPRRNREGLYALSVTVGDEPVPPLSRDDFKPAQKHIAARDASDSCERLKKATAGLDAVDDEKDVRAAAAKLDSAILTDQSKCEASADSAKTLLAQTTANWTLNPVGRGQRMTIQITTARSGTVERSWTRVYVTGARGEWRAMYAFAFIGRVVNEPRFFTKELASGGFQITQQRSRDWFDFVPSIFFAWKTPNSSGSDWSQSFTGGLGFDLTAPVVFLGTSRTFNENVMITWGLSLHRQQVLLGRYKKGDVITTNLDESQLHSQSYRPNPYIAVAFRFGANPFSPGP